MHALPPRTDRAAVAGAARRTPASRQGGAVTVLMALLVGMAVMASSFAVVQYVRISQDQSLTVHSQTEAQMNAWAGAELVRQYLEKLDSTQLASLLTAVSASSGLAITFSTGADTMAATLMSSSTSGTTSTVVVQVTGTARAGTAKATSTTTLEVQYKVVSTPATTSSSAEVTFGSNTKLTGTVTLTDASKMNINGDLTITSDTVTGLSTINATGTVNIGNGGAISLDTINSNCDVSLAAGSHSVTVNARRHICIDNSSSYVSGTATANGSIYVGSEIQQGTLAALGYTSVSEGLDSTCQPTGSAATISAATCAEPYGPGVNVSNYQVVTNLVQSDKNVYLSYGTITDIEAKGIFYANGGTVKGGTVSAIIKTSTIGTDKLSIGTPSFTLSPVTAVAVSTGTNFNAADYQQYANYAFYVANSNAYVYIKNIKGVTDGEYLLGTGSSGSFRYACATSNTSCSSSNKVIDLCWTSGSSCITASTAGSSTTWNLNLTNTSTMFVPGVVWFSGDLELNNGGFYNTFIATGNITAGNSHFTIAPNYVGKNGTINGTKYEVQGICYDLTSTAYTNYPTNFCGTNNTTFVTTAGGGTGNYAYMAGSFAGGAGSTYDASNYVGGNVVIGSGIPVKGNVLAGNAISTQGYVTVYGYVTTQGLGVTNTAQTTKISTLGGTTNIDMSNLPSTLSNSLGSGTGTTTAGSTTATILYSRFL